MKEEIIPLLQGSNDTVLQIISRKNTCVVFINLHENEQTSVAAGERCWKSHGGLLMKVRSAGERLIVFKHNNTSYTFDPNRIFTAKGIEVTMKEYGNFNESVAKEVGRVATTILNKILEHKPVLLLALHNTSGEYSIANYVPGGPDANDVSNLYVSLKKNKGDFFFTTHPPLFDFLKAGDFNVVLQNKRTARDDGSLSIAAAAHDIIYVNVEALHGNLNEQEKMIEYALKFPTIKS